MGLGSEIWKTAERKKKEKKRKEKQVLFFFYVQVRFADTPRLLLPSFPKMPRGKILYGSRQGI